MKKIACVIAVVGILFTFCSCDIGIGKEKNVTPTQTATESPVSVGDFITLGSFEQDNDTFNGKEPVEWLVLDKKGEKALVISRYVLDRGQWWETAKDLPEQERNTWGTSGERKRLHELFYEGMFNEEERKAVVKSNIENEKIVRTVSRSGNGSNTVTMKTESLESTQDYVFLLSYTELCKYFGDPVEHSDGKEMDLYKVSLTKYAFAQGTMTTSGAPDTPCYGWDLRTSCYYNDFGGDKYLTFYCRAFYDGTIMYTDYADMGVITGTRPAMWVDLNAYTSLDAKREKTEATTKATVAKNAVDFSSVSVGEIVKLGQYEQDDDVSTGKEPLEWCVLDKKDNRLLLLSKSVIERKSYCSEASSSWAASDIRRWLNTDFYKEAFTAEEKKSIAVVNIDNSESDGNGASAATKDRVFLPSIGEMQKYYPEPSTRACPISVYAYNLGTTYMEVLPGSNLQKCQFWYTRTQKRCTGSFGSGSEYGVVIIRQSAEYNSDNDTWGGDQELGIRPAMWVYTDGTRDDNINWEKECIGSDSSSSTIKKGKTTDALKVRKGPGTNYDQLGYFKKGDTVEIVGEESGFYKINYKWSKDGQSGTTAYVSADYVEIVS